MNVNQPYFGNADTVASTLLWNGPICSLCGQGYLDTHACSLVPTLCPEGREGCLVMHYGHRDAAPPAPPTFTLHCCPVCAGTGRVHRDFYGETMNTSKRIICQSCAGAGIVRDPGAPTSRGVSMPVSNVYTLTFPSPAPLEPEVRAMLAESLAETVRDALDGTAADLAVAVDHQEVE